MLEDKFLQNNTKETPTSSTVFADHVGQCQGAFPVNNGEAETVEGVSSIDQSMVMNSRVLGSPNEPDSDGKLLHASNSGEKFGEKLEFKSDPSTGVDESLKTDQHPEENNETGSGEKQKLQDVAMEDGPSEEKPGSGAAELSEKQAMPNSGTCGMKRKAERLEMYNEEAASSTPRADDLQKKWYCSLCEVSTTSEGTLNRHMQGKKHNAKEAKSKSNGTTSITNMECDSSDNSLQPVGAANSTTLEGDQTQVANKWYCSLCQVSATSEALLKSHLQGKRHKSKEARLGPSQETGNTDGPENVKIEPMTKWYCSLCQVSAASEKNLQEHFQGKKHKAKEGGKNPPENEQERTIDTNLGTLENCKIEQETGETSLANNGRGHQNQEMSEEISKYWHCKTCNERTHDEASMDAHRKSDKHREALRKNGGGVIVVSRITVTEAV